MSISSRPSAEDGSRAWTARLARYREPVLGRGIFELAVSAAAFLASWIGAWLSLRAAFWPGTLLILPAAGFLVRLFMIQHDCGHGSFFANRRLNDWTGRLIGILTLTPYGYWRRVHNVHHSTTGNLDRRGTGDVWTLTVREYEALPLLGRLRYRLARNPLVLFGLGPIWVFLLSYRLPLGYLRGREMWMSTLATNLAVAALIAGLMMLIGVGPFLAIHLPVMLLAATAGVWLFYVQHQYEDTYWEDQKGWDFHDGALHGSSHYDLPTPLRWLTLNIGMHHIHHLCSRIPSYRLPEVLRDHPELREVGRITLRQSLGCLRLNLWCEQRRRLVSFRQARLAAA
ncbi:fatty acid desaturase [Geminicoccaceae bacterium 1502E]|nr:fatty acid desaturase [Geminicoccaceae bacterium 1502E]